MAIVHRSQTRRRSRRAPCAGHLQYDALYIPDGKAAVANLKVNGAALHFVEETYKHFKTIAATGTGRDLITAAIGVPGC